MDWSVCDGMLATFFCPIVCFSSTGVCRFRRVIRLNRNKGRPHRYRFRQVSLWVDGSLTDRIISTIFKKLRGGDDVMMLDEDDYGPPRPEFTTNKTKQKQK